MPSPFRIAEKLVNWLCENGSFEDIPGDLREQFQRNLKKRNAVYAHFVYLKAVISAFQPFILREKFKYNLRIAYSISALTFYRNVNRSKFRFFLVSVGLSLSITFTSFILHYVSYELSYENSYPDYEKLYRIGSTKWATTSPLFSIQLEKEFNEINNVGRLLPIGPKILQYKTKNVANNLGGYANENFLKLFQVEILHDRPGRLLTEVNTMVITKSLASEIFANINPVNKLLTLDNKKSYLITGVIDDFPSNSHVKVSYLISLPTMYEDLPELLTSSHYTSRMYSYVKLPSDNDLENLKEKLRNYTYSYWYRINSSVTKEYIDSDNDYYEIHPINEIHLTSQRERELSENHNIVYIYILSTLAIIILILATVNFVNHLITQILRRSKELNVRKVLGASPIQLVTQFTLEFLLALIAVGSIAIAMSSLLYPAYVRLSYLHLYQNAIFNKSYLQIVGGSLILIFIIVNCLLIPLLLQLTSTRGLSNFFTFQKSSINLLDKIPLLTQSTLSIALILFSTLALKQKHFIEESYLGFNGAGMIGVNFNGNFQQKLNVNYDNLKILLDENSNINSITRVSSLISQRFGQDRIRKEKNDSAQADIGVRYLCTDRSFLPSLNISIKSGSNFSGGENEVIINETAAKMLKNTTIGSDLYSRLFGDLKVISIVKDFNYASLHSKVDPLIIINRPELANQLLISIKDENKYRTMRYLEDMLLSIAPESKLEFTYLKDSIRKEYESDNNIIEIVILFFVVGLLMLLTCIYNFINYLLESRRMEIGVRKTLGATLSDIITLLIRPIVIILLAGGAISLPLGLILSSYWLDLFEYKIQTTPSNMLVIIGVSVSFFLLIVIGSIVWKLRHRTVTSLLFKT